MGVSILMGGRPPIASDSTPLGVPVEGTMTPL